MELHLLCNKATLRQTLKSWITANALPLGVFLITRLALFFFAYLSLAMVPEIQPHWRGMPHNLFFDGWLRWDSEWYTDIARNGYSLQPLKGEQRNIVFFPLYPLLVQAVNTIIHSSGLAGLFVANAAFLLALIVFYRLIKEQFNAGIAEKSVVLLAIAPFSFFFSAMYTESLFLLAAVSAFYFGERRQWGLAALCAAAAGATRVVGFAIVFGLLLLYLEQCRFNWRKLRLNVLWLPLGWLGPFSYMAYLAHRFGDPMLFEKCQYVPGWLGNFGDAPGTIMAIHLPSSPAALLTGQYEALNFLHLAVFIVAVAALLLMLRRHRIRLSYGLWALVTLGLSFTSWRSIGRFTIVIFPVYLALALILHRERWYQAAVYASVLLLALLTFMFTHAYWVA